MAPSEVLQPKKPIDFKPVTAPPAETEEIDPEVEKVEESVETPSRVRETLKVTPVRETRALVTTRTLRVTRKPQTESDLVVLLRRGDSVTITAKAENGFIRIDYLIDGEFTVSGWAPAAAFKTLEQVEEISRLQKDIVQPFNPQERAPIESDDDLEEVPEIADEAEEPEVETLAKSLPQGSPDNLRRREGDSDADFFEIPEKAIVRKKDELAFSLKAETGFSFVSESVKTKNISGDQSYYADPFLDYEISGVEIQATGEGIYPLEELEVGGALAYGITIYNGDVSSSNNAVANSSVLGTRHDIALAPLVRRAFKVDRFTIEPELRIGVHYQVFSVNQLRAESNNQPVLFNWKNIYSKAVLRPRVYAPYGLMLEPIVGYIVFQTWSESPTQSVDNTGAALSEANQIRTGSPSAGLGGLIYGSSLIWDLQAANIDPLRIRFTYRVEDHSRSYSGRGNRAGISTLDAESQLKFTHFLLGLDYFF